MRQMCLAAALALALGGCGGSPDVADNGVTMEISDVETSLPDAAQSAPEPSNAAPPSDEPASAPTPALPKAKAESTSVGQRGTGTDTADTEPSADPEDDAAAILNTE